MSVEAWVLAAGVAGALGWAGRYVIARLPESPDAEPEAPSYPTLAQAPHLGVALAMVAVLLMSAVSVSVPPHLLAAWSVLCGVGSWLAYIDWRIQILPTRVIAGLSAAAVVIIAAEAWWLADGGILLRAVAASGAAYAVFWLFWWFAELHRPGSFGFGDVRFAAPLGLVLGSVSGWTALVGLELGLVAGGLAGLVFKARGRHDAFALGPWLLLGAVLGAGLVGPAVR